MTPEQIEQLQQKLQDLQLWYHIAGWTAIGFLALFVVSAGVGYWIWRQRANYKSVAHYAEQDAKSLETQGTRLTTDYNLLVEQFTSIRRERDERSHELMQLQRRYRTLDLQHLHTRGELWHLLTIDGGDNWLRFDRDGRNIVNLRLATDEEVGVIRGLERLQNLGFNVTPGLLEGLRQAGFSFHAEEVDVIPAGNRPIVHDLVSQPEPSASGNPRMDSILAASPESRPISGPVRQIRPRESAEESPPSSGPQSVRTSAHPGGQDEWTRFRAALDHGAATRGQPGRGDTPTPAAPDDDL